MKNLSLFKIFLQAKELLDAELDLYKKQHTQNADEDTTELLLQKVNLMKTKVSLYFV